MMYSSRAALVMYPQRDTDFPLLKLFVEGNLYGMEYEIVNRIRTPIPRYIKLYWCNWQDGLYATAKEEQARKIMREWFNYFPPDEDGRPLMDYEFLRIGADTHDVEEHGTDRCILELYRNIHFTL